MQVLFQTLRFPPQEWEAFPTPTWTFYPNLDFVVFPDAQTTPSAVLAGIGTLECSLPTNTCPIQLSVDYASSLAALPGLSSDPNDYSLFNVVGFPAGKVTFNEQITSTNSAGVPESTVLPGLVAAGADRWLL